MKRIYILFSLLMFSIAASAQNPTTYFMDGTPLRSQWNPSFTTERGYVNIPFIGGIQAGTSGNIAISKLFYPTGDGSLATIFSGSVPASTALGNLEEMNTFGIGLDMNIIGFGAYTKKRQHFWSAGINLRTNVDMNLPYGLFDFMKNGDSADIANLGLSLESCAEAYFSYTFPVRKNIDLGIRAKALIGLGRCAMNFDRFDAQLNAASWSAHAAGSMEFSGLMPATKTLAGGRQVYDMAEMANSFKAPAGYGFGFDVGATWTPIKNLRVSASVNDIGMMFWSKSATSIGGVDHTINFSGVETDENGNAIRPEFNLDELEFDVRDSHSIKKALHASINVGGEYNFLDHRIGLGVFYQAKFWEYSTRHNVTFSANFRPLKWLHITGSYSVIDNDANAVGLALNLCPKFISFFVATDILLSKKTPQWIPIKQSNMNVTFGLAVPFGKGKNVAAATKKKSDTPTTPKPAKKSKTKK